MIDHRISCRLVASAAHRISEQQDELSRLDAVAGDGDHGVNMAIALAEAVRRSERPGHDTAAAVFRTTGKAFHDTVGGAAGALFGAFFSALGARLDRAEAPDTADFVDGVRLGLARVVRLGRSAPRQKTMIDALGPAADSASAVVAGGDALGAVLRAAASAAREGAASTAGMRPSAGRARYAPDASMGTVDPGACTVALIFEAWADELEDEVLT
ncbi:MAG: DAK2 domain-containing protein [bacterium]|nr:DAK2 domain-containing protein [bacterium]